MLFLVTVLCSFYNLSKTQGFVPLSTHKPFPILTHSHITIENHDVDATFTNFVSFLISTQNDIIRQLETMDGSGQVFSRDAWGVFETPLKSTGTSGGITRVIQQGHIIEKGACSLTLLRNGTLTKDRAATIASRQNMDSFSIQEGDVYDAAALSLVLHTASPMIPTFRSDVRVFRVTSKKSHSTRLWFGGGADLTPYFLFDEDIHFFHNQYKLLCDQYFESTPEFSYASMKQACDEYFYLPARQEHRGTGGVFFDDMCPENVPNAASFIQQLALNFMPSWLPIVQKRREITFNEKQKHWQLLRRGRYLEFNLLYDRGVKFGLASANPRVEGVMISAPPLIAWEYNHQIEEGSEESRLMNILRRPVAWA